MIPIIMALIIITVTVIRGVVETYSYDENGNYLGKTYENWDPATQNLADLLDNPTPPTGETATLTDSYSYVDYNYTGYLEGRMGGTASLWTGSNIPFTILGLYEHYYDSIWYDYNNIESYNEINNTYTTYDGGAYTGFIGGTVVGNGFDSNNDPMEGLLVALYMDPDGNAGFLRGTMSGTGYPASGIFELDGTINREQFVAASGIDIAPEDFVNSIWWGDGNAGLRGTLGTSGTIDMGGDYYYYDSYFETMSVVDDVHNVAQPWGIYMIEGMYGSFENPNNATTWTSIMGGEGEFGAYFDESGNSQWDYGYFLGGNKQYMAEWRA